MRKLRETVEGILSVIIPVFNEEGLLEENSLRLHFYLHEKKIPHEVLVVSNGSTDRTDEIARRLESQHSWFRFFSIDEKSPGKAFALGVRKAHGEWVVTQDMDLSSELTFLDYAWGLSDYCDMLVGSKSMGRQRRSVVRVLGSQSYLLLSQLAFSLTISDYSMGAKAIRRSLILPILDNLDTWTGYMLEICLYLDLRDKRVLQIGIECEDTRNSRFNLFHEGAYRYRHLYSTWKSLKDKKTWFHSTD